jgi:hypothetical protein
MNILGQIIAYIMAAVLLAFAFWLANKKQYQLAAIVVAPSFAAFFTAQLMSGGVFKFQNNLTTEQILCWGFGFAFFVMSCYFVKKDSLAYAFVIFLISVLTCFCGLSGVQALLKTHLLWQVTDSLKAYSEKIDKFQNTVAEMHQSLSQQQSELTSNQFTMLSDLNAVQTKIAKQQDELTTIQTKIRNAESNVVSQQADITNQFHRISTVQSELTAAQTNVNAQAARLDDLDSLVSSLFSKTEVEKLTGTDTNRVVIIHLAGSERVFFKMQFAPVPYTVEGISMGGGTFEPAPLLPSSLSQFENILIVSFSGINVETATFEFRYIKDIRQTNLVHTIALQTTNIVSFDGNLNLVR